VWVAALPPAVSIRVLVPRRPVASTSAQWTRAPASASRTAQARPMPPAAPVTKAVRPVRSYAEGPWRDRTTGSDGASIGVRSWALWS
jgi:hypothetical protein